MSETSDASEAAQRLVEAEKTLRRVIQAGEELEAASNQLEEGRRDIEKVTQATLKLLNGVRVLGKEALGAVRAVQALDVEELFGRIDALREDVAGTRRIVRVVLMAVSAGVLLLGGLLVLWKA